MRNIHSFVMRSTFCLVAIAISGVFSASIDLHPLSDEFINLINSKQSTWTAGRNFDKNTPLSHIHGLLGVLKSPGAKAILNVRHHNEDVAIPDTFDARENWPNCETIKDIRDQSQCGSCWAVSATSVMSDRICIHSDGKKQVYVSDQDLLSCCMACGYGCNGGLVVEAWYYWLKQGISSGGPYNSTTGCKSYSMLPCDQTSIGNKPSCSNYNFSTPECKYECDLGSSLDYDSDKSYGQNLYTVVSSEEQIQLEIMKNGPVQATFMIYVDFWSYRSGVYQNLIDDDEGLHAVRIIGWGVENDTPYWLVANSFNEDWGDNGLFKIIRGRNECGIEDDIIAGLPKL